MSKKGLAQALKYTLFSVSAGVIQASSFALLSQVLFSKRTDLFWLFHIVALVLSVIWNFTLNRKFTFGASNNVPIAMLKVAAFYGVFTPMSAYLGQLAVNGGLHSLLTEGLTMLANFALEFLYFKHVVFREKKG